MYQHSVQFYVKNPIFMSKVIELNKDKSTEQVIFNTSLSVIDKTNVSKIKNIKHFQTTQLKRERPCPN